MPTAIGAGAGEVRVGEPPALGLPEQRPARIESFDDLLADLATGKTIPFAVEPDIPPEPEAGGGPAVSETRFAGTTSQVDVFAAAQGEPRTCPCCRQSRAPGARICVECGVDLKTGRALLTTDETHLNQAYIYAQSVIALLSWLVPIGVYPIVSEAFGLRKPWVTRGIAIFTTLVSLWFMVAFIYSTAPPNPKLAGLMLWCGQRAGPEDDVVGREEIEAGLESGRHEFPVFRGHQLLTATLLHADPFHLARNLLFLMVLGARVNALIGNLLTLLVYPLLAVGSGLIYALSAADGLLHPSLGASGAIMGLAGMYLVFFPAHKVHVAAWWRLGWFGMFQLNQKEFAVRGFWVVLFYIGFDVVFTVFGWEDDVAHWAHLGGFIVGVALALLLLLTRAVNARGGDLLSVTLGRHAWALVGKPNRRQLPLW